MLTDAIDNLAIEGLPNGSTGAAVQQAAPAISGDGIKKED